MITSGCDIFLFQTQQDISGTQQQYHNDNLQAKVKYALSRPGKQLQYNIMYFLIIFNGLGYLSYPVFHNIAIINPGKQGN